MTELELKIYDIVRKIPAGKIATYGQVAEAAGDRHLARVVGNVMHKNPVPYWELAQQVGWKGDITAEASRASEGFGQVPCHRVVNATGKMGTNFGLGGPKIQAEMLRAEGVEVSLEKLKICDLEKYMDGSR